MRLSTLYATIALFAVVSSNFCCATNHSPLAINSTDDNSGTKGQHITVNLMRDLVSAETTQIVEVNFITEGSTEPDFTVLIEVDDGEVTTTTSKATPTTVLVSDSEILRLPLSRIFKSGKSGSANATTTTA
jgi:TRAP-type C4-dicarboxylate transport system substrate-binding protein